MKLLSTLLFVLSLTHHTHAYRISGISVGVNSTTGERPFRKEIYQVNREEFPTFVLLILSVQKLLAIDQNDPLSWYQIAGIHGRPFKPWDGVAGTNAAGYCTHDATLFPPWHRPYVALFEQVLYGHVQTIAAQYPAAYRPQYQAAAVKWRLPYWDWASDARVPEFIAGPTVEVFSPTGWQTIPNPFYRYSFHPPIPYPDFDNEFINAPYTLRRPNFQEALFARKQAGLGGFVYALFAEEKSWTAFSSTIYRGPNGETSQSLEALHNGIHGDLGGWQTNSQYAAFDPIFMLHHANTDRLLAFRQALIPDINIVPTESGQDTYVDAKPFMQVDSSRLYPFHSDAGSAFWTAASAWKTRTFGYTYPEIVDWDTSRYGLCKRALTTLSNLYDPQHFYVRPEKVKFCDRLKYKRSDVPVQSESDALNQTTEPEVKFLREGQRRRAAALEAKTVKVTRQSDNLAPLRDPETGSIPQWAANIRMDEHAAGQSYQLHLFLGAVPLSPKDWSTSLNRVGSFTAFTSSKAGAERGDIYGQVPLTFALVKKYLAKTPAVPDLSPASMKTYLKANLAWRAEASDGTEVPLSTIKGLKVIVVFKKTDAAGNSEQVPEEGITAGKLGGPKVGQKAKEAMNGAD